MPAGWGRGDVHFDLVHGVQTAHFLGEMEGTSLTTTRGSLAGFTALVKLPSPCSLKCWLRQQHQLSKRGRKPWG